MVNNAPVRFTRVAAAFEARVRLCESSGSEHSAEEDSPDLSDLVNSFMETDGGDEAGAKRGKKRGGGDGAESESYWSSSENKDRLIGFLTGDDEDGAKQRIRAQAELALETMGTRGRGYKRELMSCLRDGGFDAGLCKSRWEKKGNMQAGNYEYVDVKVNDTRYIVEVHLSEEFSIARPTTSYASLLSVFPEIFVGTTEDLKQITRIVCAAAKESMKHMDMPMAPWRRNSYMQAKWLSSYKRTSNAQPVHDSYVAGLSVNRSIGFDPVQTPEVNSYYCRENLGGKIGGLRVEHLSAVLSSE